MTRGNVALLGRFALRRLGCGRRRGRNFYRRIIGSDLGQWCNTCRRHNLRVRTGFACDSTGATVGAWIHRGLGDWLRDRLCNLRRADQSLGGCRQYLRPDRRLASRDINER